MKKGDYLSVILRSKKTVFSTKDLALMWSEPITDATKTRIKYYIQMKKLIRFRRGLYAKEQDYNPLELATKIFTPSYVSFETVLAREGIIFQHYSQIFVASYLTRDIICDSHTYSFRKIKDLLLTNGIGIENKNECSIASAERAFLDTLYLNKDYHFDNVSPLNWDKIFEWLPFYENKRMEEQVKKLFKASKQNGR